MNTLTRLLTLLAFGLTALAARATVAITAADKANITPAGFTVLWRVDSATGGSPRLDVFSNAAGTVSVRSQLAVEFFPLEMNDTAVKNTATQRDARRALQDAVRARKAVLARVTGAQPGTTYYVRPRSVDASGNPNETALAPLLTVTTSQETAFVAESRQLRVDFQTCFPGSDGLIARLSLAGAPTPLVSVIGDHDQPGRAFFDLTLLLNAAGTTNAELGGTPAFTLDIVGDNGPPGSYSNSISLQNAYVVAKLEDTTFVIGFPGLVSFTVEGSGSALAGVPYPVTIKARAADNSVLTSFNGTVTVAATAPLYSGAGVTPIFTAGVLTGYEVIPSAAGSGQLIATRTCGLETGLHNYTAAALTYTAWKQFYFGANAGNAAISGLDADPDGDGIKNGLEYFAGYSPVIGNKQVIESEGLDGTDFVFTYRKAKLAPGLTPTVQWTPDLSLWRTDLVTQTQLADQGATVLMEARIPTGTRTDSFGRIKVSIP